MQRLDRHDLQAQHSTDEKEPETETVRKEEKKKGFVGAAKID